MTSDAAAERGSDWPPTATRERLRARAELLARVREFFAARGVLEVETPLLSAAAVTDPHLESVACRLELPGQPGPRTLFLQTSPEFAMKRLLAAGSGAIYQMGRAVRDGEVGRHHNPEFTLLEWYRPGFDHHALMDEVEDLLRAVLGDRLDPSPAERVTYADAYARWAGVDAHRDEVETLADRARSAGIDLAWGNAAEMTRDDWLHLLGSHLVDPHLGMGGHWDSRLQPNQSQPNQPQPKAVGSQPRISSLDASDGGRLHATFLYDYPASQAALARLGPATDPQVAERFEVYVAGVELANGFHELRDAVEQRRRFERDIAERARRGMPTPPLDERLLAALDAGLPPCAGVALGIDRLAMLAVGAERLDDVLAFPIGRA